MLGILLLYFLARWVYNLAKKHDKPNKWLYGLLAVVTYYGAGIGTVLLIIILDIGGMGSGIDSQEGELVLSLLAIPFGVGAVALLHYLLKRSWSKEIKSDDGLLDESMDELA
ncbi:hypothetical protein N9Y60_00705 [Crocinitomicaceae bacterium]|nr:hypothetical protein [Crocinitomicaceae bacterium]